MLLLLYGSWIRKSILILEVVQLKDKKAALVKIVRKKLTEVVFMVSSEKTMGHAHSVRFSQYLRIQESSRFFICSVNLRPVNF